ncbi:MAG: hypothetical protein AB7E51_06795 [Pseudodesulfovibrio sp.]|uniref:hypothetical protein n=1 Tax=Pseudodesulfovibrio sp. TaxID=2035812 RepID=UPI003D12652D
MTFASIYTDAYERFGQDARFYPRGGGAFVECRVRMEYAGMQNLNHGDSEKALIKVLWTDFPEAVEGHFVFPGHTVEWKILEPGGHADGHREGRQRVFLCGANRRLSVEK